MKKVAIFIPTLNRGGAERVAVRLAGYIVDKGYRCEIITLSKPSEKEYTVPVGVERSYIQSRNILKLRNAIKESYADILLIMDTPICVFAIPACIGLSIKTVVSERSAPEQFEGRNITRIVSRFLMRFADGFVFQTDEVKKYYSKKLKGKGVVIPNPIQVDELPRPYEGMERDKKIVSVGRLKSVKNHKMLIEAFGAICKDYPDFSLTIYGEGELRQELEGLIAQKQLEDRILMPGNQPDVLNRIRSASIFVMSSNYEGMPNALIEAMSIGLPCISTDCPSGGARSLIESGKNGVLIPVGNKEALISALRDLLNNPIKAEGLGREALSIRNSLDIEKVGKMWISYFESILQ